MTISEWTWTALNAGNVNQVPEVGGVYMLGDGSGTPRVFYVGQSSGLRTRLTQHLNEASNPCISRHVRAGGTYFVYKTVPGGESARTEEERRLIGQYRPECNT